jgi:TolA-binding protein
VLAEFPKSELCADAITGIQWSMMQKGDTQAAAGVVQQYIKQLPDRNMSAQILQRQAELFVNNQQYAEAVQQYQTILDDYPSSPAAQTAYWGIGQAREKMGDPAAAIAAYRKQSQNYPKVTASADALLALGRLHYEGKEYRQSIDALEEVRRTFPQYEKKGQADYQIGMSYLDSGDAEKAQNYFATVAQTDSNEQDQALALLGLARVHYQQQQYQQAQQTLEQVITKADKTAGAQALSLLGDSHRMQRQYQEAIVAYLKIKYLYPSETAMIAGGLYQAGQCYEQQSRFADARRLYQTILNEYPGQQAWVKQAQARMQALLGK